MRKVDKILGLDDQLVGNQMHHFGVANPVEHLLRVLVDFSHVEREFWRRPTAADAAALQLMIFFHRVLRATGEICQPKMTARAVREFFIFSSTGKIARHNL
jgi:hypothetical protein